MTDEITPAASLPQLAIDRRTIEDAIHAWFASATGLGAERVWWQDNDIVETQMPFGTLAWLSTTPLGMDGQGVEALIENEDLEDDGESDVRLWSGGLREVVISVQVFANPKGAPEASAFLRLEAAIAKLALPTVREALNDAGFGVLRIGGIRNVAAGQCACELVGTVASNASEDVRSIQGVRVLSTNEDLEVDVIAPEGFTPP